MEGKIRLPGMEKRLFHEDIGVQLGGLNDGEYNPAAAPKYGLPGYSDRLSADRPRYGSDGAWLESPFRPKGLKDISPRIVEEPEFGEGGETISTARELYRPLVERLNEYLADEAGAVLSYGDLKIREMEPSYTITGDGRIAKVLGLYNTETKDLFLSSDLKGEEVSEVMEHELLHYVQDKFGVIGRYLDENPRNAREMIERDAEERQDYINRRYQSAMPAGFRQDAGLRQAA